MAAMTKNTIAMIDAIAKGDMPKARVCAQCCIAEDTSKKNEYECKRLARALDPALNPQIEEMPWNIKGMLEAENPRDSFQVARYYLSPRESFLFNSIDRERKVCDELMQMRIRHPNTTLLYGESGTGKTSFGRFVAYAFNLPFYYVNFSRLVDGLMGKTAQNLAAVFDYVRTVPCVLMLDEIDSVSTKREGAGGGVSGELNRVTVTLMQEFDKLNNNQVVIGATNRLDIIDSALVRRFSRIHEIIAPIDEIEASRVVMQLLDDVSIPYNRGQIVSFCSAHASKPQSWLINQTVSRIADMIALQQTLEEAGNADFTVGIEIDFEGAEHDPND